jgi:carboxyl-terminal processing protease
MKRTLRFFAVFVAALAATLSLAQPATAQRELDQKAKEAVLKDMEAILTNVAFVPGVDFEKWPDLLGQYRDQLDEAKTPDQFAGVVNTALQQFGFSHILLFSPTAAERRATNRMVGIGVRIEIEEKGIRVVRVYEDGAAHAAGVKIGDLIFEADGKPVRQPGDLAGEEGQPVKVKIDRNGVVIEREMVRKAFAITLPEELTFPEKETALLTIPSFDQTYSLERVQELMSKADDAKHLILDLRGNGGGRVINLLHMSSFLLTREQPLGTFVDKPAVKKFQEETGEKSTDVFKIAEWSKNKLTPLRRNKEPFKGDIVVLIDGGTGSASEMIAAALKEHRGATIIGSPSAGAVLASTMRPMEHGFLLQFPVMDYVTIKGKRLEGNGLVPDITAPAARFGAPDEGVQQALKVFKQHKDGEEKRAA